MNVFLIYLTSLFQLYRFYNVKWKIDSEWWIGKEALVVCFKGNWEKPQEATVKRVGLRASEPLEHEAVAGTNHPNATFGALSVTDRLKRN
jgi:hypothetical protein